MSTSTKVQFNLETLKKKALESIDFRIAQTKLEIERSSDESKMAEAVADWRRTQEQKVSNLFRQLGDGGIDDFRLSDFQIDPIPTFDRYEKNRLERELRSLEFQRSQILAKGSSLVADEDGNISLTSRQMEDFFGL